MRRAKHANDGRPGFAKKKKKTKKKHVRQRPASSAALLRSRRPNTPSILTRFQQRDMRKDWMTQSNQDRAMIMKQEADMRARVERSIRTRPHSSPPRGRRSGAVQSRGGTLLSPMQRNSQSTPALHAVFSPQVPYYAGGLEAQAREKRKWIARKERARRRRQEERRQQQSRKTGTSIRS